MLEVAASEVLLSTLNPFEPQTTEERDAYHRGRDLGIPYGALLVESCRADRQRRLAEAAEQRSAFDPMTGLITKHVWNQEVGQRITEGKAFGVAFWDIDNFKLVNDRYGHLVGDKLLAALGSALKREADLISGHLGGDEFGTIFDLSRGGEGSTRSLYKAMDNAVAYLSRVRDCFVDSLPENIRKPGFGVSIGVALFDPAYPVDAETLIAQADEAMYEAKEYDEKTVGLLDQAA